MGLKRHPRGYLRRRGRGFRRTLVGLKRGHCESATRVGPFQTDPCGVEASCVIGSVFSDAFQTDPCGVEATRAEVTGTSLNLFQTDPCGVEADFIYAGPSGDSLFQTDPCGVEAERMTRSRSVKSCFRRTLVGLKLHRTHRGRTPLQCFRRTLVGLKLSISPRRRVDRVFQTDPCGVEALRSTGSLGGLDMFQTDPCGVEATEPRENETMFCGVSDGPLWG